MACREERPSSDSEYELAEEYLQKDTTVDEIISFALGEPIADTVVESNAPDTDADSSPSPDDEDDEPPSESEVTEPEPYPESELEAIRSAVLELKNEGNTHFRSCEYYRAMEVYSEALVKCRRQLDEERGVLYANRAACHLAKEEYAEAEEDCTSALELNSKYVKALLRRAQAREKLDKLSPALEDYEKVLELDPGNRTATPAALRLPDQVKQQQEKLKEECIGKLKDLGNLVLRPFGLSTDNFKMVQDPNTGGYNIQFSQEK